jgi:glycosyltransferase involved in cell wall biosynthesis
VTLLVIADKAHFRISEDIEDCVKIIETPDLFWQKRLRSGWDPWDVFSRCLLLNKIKIEFDLLHLFDTRPVTIHPALIYLKKRPIPIFIDWIEWWGKGGTISVNRPIWYQKTLAWIEEYYEEHFRCLADGSTVISSALAERAKGLGVNPDSILVLKGGIDKEYMKPIDIGLARKMVGIANHQLVIGGFSSQDSHLDLEEVLKAIKIVKPKEKRFKLMITGHKTPRFLNLLKKYKLRDEIILPGFVPADRYPIYLNCCNFFILPYPKNICNIGRWPNKIGDYMGVGRPTITNSIGDLKDLFENNNIGIMCDYNAHSFADAIVELAQNPDSCAQLGNNARKVAEEEFGWDHLVERLETFYFRVLSLQGR